MAYAQAACNPKSFPNKIIQFGLVFSRVRYRISKGNPVLTIYQNHNRGENMKKRTGLALIILTAILAACTAQAAPAPTETPLALPPTPTTQPSATAQSTAVPTVTPTPLSPDAQALKDIVFSDCIPVEESLPEGMEIPWSLLARDGESVFILNPKDGTEVIVPHFSGVSRERDNTFLLASTISPDGKWLAYLDTSRKKIFVEPAETILTNKETDRIEWEREQRVYMPQWIDDDTLLVIQTPPEEDSFYPTIFFKPFTGEEYIFSLEAMPNYLDYKIGGIGFRTHYNHSGELVPDPIMKKVVYPEKLNDELYNPHSAPLRVLQITFLNWWPQ
jgi:hypothetical protein